MNPSLSQNLAGERVESIFGPSYRAVTVSDVKHLAVDAPLRLDSGTDIRSFPFAYKTYGQLNTAKTNAILICHGLTGDQYAAEDHPVTGKPGWWLSLIGSGKALDTNKYFIIAPNVLGGCMGSFGPKEKNPETGHPYNLSFPVITIRDMVRAQALLVDSFGIDRLFSILGGSMGGMQVLEWAACYPERIASAVAIASAPRHTAQNIAFHEIGRQAIMADPDWRGGDYLLHKSYPSKGLAVARMTAHITYLSEAALARKFGRQLQDREEVSYGFGADFRVESYLRYQGQNFVERFDPNSYLYITRAMDYFDLAQEYGSLANAFAKAKANFCVVSFSSDWLFPTEESRQVVFALAGTARDVSFVEIESDKGHDAFLLDEPAFFRAMEGFMRRQEKEVKL